TNRCPRIDRAMLKAENPDSALSYFDEAVPIFRQVKDHYGLTKSLAGLGEAHAMMGHDGEAMRYLREAQRLAQTLNLPALYEATHRTLYSAHRRFGRADSALVYYEKYVEIKDSISANEVKKEIERLKIAHETELKEEENQRLNAELDLTTAQKERNRIVLIITVIAALLLLGALGALFYFRQQARQRELEVLDAERVNEQQQKELVQSRLGQAQKLISEKNQLLAKLEEDLRNSDVDITELADKLHDRINTNKDWMQFMIEFEMVYKGFFDALRPEENKLTKNDLRLASLIKLNLSNKEIAEVLSITPEGVKKAKNRLKKKLGLAQEVGLNDFVTRISG
ncbi:MAG: tetratricopeptide repeat protein, partial [Bacteroidota bacterium]